MIYNLGCKEGSTADILQLPSQAIHLVLHRAHQNLLFNISYAHLLGGDSPSHSPTLHSVIQGRMCKVYYSLVEKHPLKNKKR